MGKAPFDPIDAAKAIGELRAHIGTMPSHLRPVGDAMLAMTDAAFAARVADAAHIAEIEAEVVRLREALADHRLAVALAMQKAHDCIEANPQPCSPVYPASWTYEQLDSYEAGQLDAAVSFQSAILAIADSDALAEVQELKAERYALAVRVKELMEAQDQAVADALQRASLAGQFAEERNWRIGAEQARKIAKAIRNLDVLTRKEGA